MAVEDLAVPYHQQDGIVYCGPACAQMVLDMAAVGAGLIDQNELSNDIQPNNIEAGWASSPAGLKWTMNNRKPAGFPRYFEQWPLNTEDSISRKIIWTIHRYQVAPIALVFGAQHWIVIRGYQASAAPAAEDDVSYSIAGFYTNNPAPRVPRTGRVPPHAPGDLCGSCGKRGVADEYIAYPQWQSTYMTGVDGGTMWLGKFVAVCDPDLPPTRAGTPGYVPNRRSGDVLLTPDEATRHAGDGLRAHGLLEDRRYRAEFEYAVAAESMLVQRLDRVDSFYYIVPLQRDGVTTVVSLVDGRTGEFLQSAVRAAEDYDLLADWVGRRAAAKQVIGMKVELPQDSGALLLRKEATSHSLTLVWKPCRESLSPLYPFHLFTTGAHQIYVRTDGEVFTELHDRGRGE